MEKKSHVRLVHVIRGVLLACLVMSAALFAAPQTQAATANEKTTFEFLTSHMGLNPAAACGIMGSIKAESNFTSDIYGLGGAYGLCQWMGIRVTRLKNYCSQHGLDYTSLKGQLYYLEYETKTTFPSVYNYLKSVSNTSEGAYNAGYYWCYNFEIPGDRHNASVYRAKIARDTFWKEFGGSYVQVSGAQAGTGVKLTWTGTSKYGFAVRRSENETAGYTVVGKAGASTKAFVDTKVLPGHTYYYCVRPLNADGSLGNKSNIISVHVKASLTDSRCKITVGARVFVYNAKQHRPAVRVTWNGKVLTNGVDYTVAYENNINAGIGTIAITGKGEYYSRVRTGIRIDKAPQVIDAKSIILELKSAGQRMPATAKGKITLTSADPTVFATKGSYIYTKKAGRAVLTITAAATANYKASAKKVWVNIRPTAPVVTATNIATRTIKANWKAACSPAGYQLRYMDTANTAKLNYVELPSGRLTGRLIGGLIKGRTYTVRIRSYVLVNNVKVWSNWSSVVKVKIER